jgi:hypothetical protein
MLYSLAVVLSIVAAPNGQLDAKQLIEKMLVRYHGAKTLVGTIDLTVSTQAGSASLKSTLQYERPAKLYLLQEKLVANPDPEQPARWLITSDGTKFSYGVPNDRFHAAPGLRLIEPVENARVKTKHDLGSIYAASSKSIGDRSMPLDIAIAARTDLVYRRAQWATYSVLGKKELDGKSVSVIGGDFRQYAGAPVTGKFEMAVTNEGDLVQYLEKTNVMVGEGAGARSVEVISRWDVDLRVGAMVNPALFNVVIR